MVNSESVHSDNLQCAYTANPPSTHKPVCVQGISIYDRQCTQMHVTERIQLKSAEASSLPNVSSLSSIPLPWSSGSVIVRASLSLYHLKHLIAVVPHHPL